MANSIESIRTDKKKLMMELQNLNLNTPEGKARREEIKKEMESLDRDLRAFAQVLGNDDNTPRMMLYKGKEGK